MYIACFSRGRRSWYADLTWTPHNVLMTSLSGHNSYELHVFVGMHQKWRVLEASQQKYKHIHNILFVALKFCSVFAHFVRSFIVFYFLHIHKEDHAGSIIRHNRKDRLELWEEKSKRNRSKTVKHVLLKDKIYNLFNKYT